MARPLRICLPNLTYHVFSRCIEQQPKMKPDLYKELMLEVVGKAMDKYRFELISYQIMDNHFHFVIKTVEEGACISRIMQYIKARFAESYNKRLNRVGAFWSERFKDQIVEYTDNPSVYLLWLLWYLAFNPVRKGMVRDPREYKYGSINAYINGSYFDRIKITQHQGFLSLGSTIDERVRRFLLYEEAYRKRHPVYA